MGVKVYGRGKVAELRRLGVTTLQAAFGDTMGLQVHNMANGICHKPVKQKVTLKTLIVG